MGGLKGDACMSEDQRPGRAGGLARAQALSSEQRTDQAKHAAEKRWDRPIAALRKGSFKEQFGIDVECYVLDDDAKTPVISQTGMARILGLSSRGNAFPRFLSSNAMSEYVGAEIRGKVQNTLKFQWGSGGAEQPPAVVHGYNAEMLIDVCQAIIAADNAKALKAVRYAKIAKQAYIILGASAKDGIKGLVYALSGYSRTDQEVIDAFKLYVLEEAKKYEPEFPNELYMQWHRLYKIPVPIRGKPWYFKYLTVKHVYYPLAKSQGRIYTLIKALKAKEGDRQKKLFQFLNNIGARALRMQLGRILEMAESSPDRQSYEDKIVERFGGQPELNLLLPTFPTFSPPLS